MPPHHVLIARYAAMPQPVLCRLLCVQPYHNAIHAASVLQHLHLVITRGGMVGGYVDQTLRLAAYLAAIVHDFEHKGRNNDYLINTHDDLAVRYNGEALASRC